MVPLPPIAVVPLGGRPLESTLVTIRPGPLLELFGLLAAIAVILLAQGVWQRRRRWNVMVRRRARRVAWGARLAKGRPQDTGAPSGAEALR